MLFRSLGRVVNVIRVHDLRIWSLTTDRIAVSVHLAINSCGETTVDGGACSERTLQEATKMLRLKHGIHMSGFEYELLILLIARLIPKKLPTSENDRF